MSYIKNIESMNMKTVTLQIDDKISDKFSWLLEHFSKNEIKTLDQHDYLSDDEYLRSIDGMVESVKEAKAEANIKGVGLSGLNW